MRARLSPNMIDALHKIADRCADWGVGSSSGISIRTWQALEDRKFVKHVGVEKRPYTTGRGPFGRNGYETRWEYHAQLVITDEGLKALGAEAERYAAQAVANAIRDMRWMFPKERRIALGLPS